MTAPTVEDFDGFRRVAEFYLDLRPEWKPWLSPALDAITTETAVLAAYGLVGDQNPWWDGDVRNPVTTSRLGRTFSIELPSAAPITPGDRVEVRVVPDGDC